MESSPYAVLVKDLEALNPRDGNFARKLNELISINELLTTLNTARTLEETLDIILLTILGEYGCLRGGIFVKSQFSWRLGIGKGIKNQSFDLSGLALDHRWDDLPTIIRGPAGIPPELGVFFENDVFQFILAAKNEGKLTGLVCLGKSMLGPAAAAKENLLSTIADFGGVIIGNRQYKEDLEQVNRQLQRQIFQLNTLYEITGAFARCYEDDEVYQVLSNTLMGQFFISRSAVLDCGECCSFTFVKGLKTAPDEELPLNPEPLSSWPARVLDVAEVACDAVAAIMKAHRLQYALPIASEGASLGLLLLGPRLDRKPLEEADRDFILSLCQQSAVAIENVALQKEALEKKRMEKELQLAREIQQKLLPKGVPSISGYELAVEMRPFYQVGGDFYDFIALENGKLSICLADVSGKSLPASMIMSTAQASLRALNSFSGLSPKDVIERLNRHMCSSTSNNKFITMFYAVLDPATHKLSYINAGHNRPILICPDKSTVLLDKGGMVVGLFPTVQYQVGEVIFEEGTELLIYTDGLSEVTDPNGEEYGDDRLIDTLKDMQGRGSVESEKDDIVNDVMTFSRNEMVDDLTLLLVRRKRTDA